MPPREIRGLGYEGSYVTVASYVRPRRRARQPQATVRFETASGEQAQLEWGNFTYIGDNWRQHRVWAFVMVLSWSRSQSLYVGSFGERTPPASYSAMSTPSSTSAAYPGVASTTTPRW